MGWGGAWALGGDGGKVATAPSIPPWPPCRTHKFSVGWTQKGLIKKSSMSESDGRVGRAGAMRPQVPVVAGGDGVTWKMKGWWWFWGVGGGLGGGRKGEGLPVLVSKETIPRLAEKGLKNQQSSPPPSTETLPPSCHSAGGRLGHR